MPARKGMKVQPSSYAHQLEDSPADPGLFRKGYHIHGHAEEEKQHTSDGPCGINMLCVGVVVTDELPVTDKQHADKDKGSDSSEVGCMKRHVIYGFRREEDE